MRVMIVDDHTMFAEGLARLISRHEAIDEVVIAESVAAVRDADPVDFAVVDWHLADGRGTDAIELIRSRSAASEIVVLTGSAQPYMVSESRALGCLGVLTKDQAASDLLALIDGPGDTFTMSPSAAQAAEVLGSVQLSDRELEVVRALARGSTNSEIADELFVSVNTVRNHIQRIAGKLGVRTRLEVVMTSLRRGLVELPDS